MGTEINRLLAKIRGGDMAALESLYNTLKKGVYLYALSLLGDKTTAEDVLQDTFIRVFARSKTQAPEKDGKAWVFAITRNLCLDRLKSPAHAVLPLEDGEERGSPAQSFDFIVKVELRDAILRLEDEARTVVLMHLAAGFTFREVAAALGHRQNTVQWIYYSAIKKLSRYYNEAPSKGAGHEKTKECV